MARLIYACRFEVPGKELAEILAAYSKWIEGHYQERRRIADFNLDLANDEQIPTLPQGHTISKSRFVGTKGEVATLVWSFPADTDEGLQWRNEIRFGKFGELCGVEHLIYINSIDYRITPAQLALGSPSIIRDLCSANAVQIGDMHIKATPYPLVAEDVTKFLELLQSSKRRLPIVLISPYANGEANTLNASAIAQHLAGVGIVVRIQDSESTWEIAEAIGRPLSCFDGGARIYWPGFLPTHDPRSHRLYLGARIEALGPQSIARSIERSIFAVAAFRFVPDQRINEIVFEAEQAQRMHRVETQKASSGEDLGTICA